VVNELLGDEVTRCAAVQKERRRVTEKPTGDAKETVGIEMRRRGKHCDVAL
jgi:hypothetical protein